MILQFPTTTRGVNSERRVLLYDTEGRSGYHSGFLSMGTIRNFCSRHRDVTLRAGQSKTIAKLMAENPTHASTLKEVLERIQSEYPNIMANGDKVCNMD